MSAAIKATELKNKPSAVIGVFAPCDPRIDAASRTRAANIVRMTADLLAQRIPAICSQSVQIVWSDVLIDGEAQADEVARRFKAAGVQVLVGVPDTWAFPQLTLISLLAHFPSDIPLNLTVGNSGPRPGVVYAHAATGALAQSGRLSHLNVGTWPDTGAEPAMTPATADTLVDWCYAALTRTALRGRRVVVFGHDSMGMETALAHIIPTRNTFGLEITRLDMKLPADMLAKGAYDKKEVAELDAWLKKMCPGKISLTNADDEKRWETELAMYLVMRNLMADLDAVGGGFMSQLEWGSDKRGLPLPVADVMESLFNATFDHHGRKLPVPFATEADVQGLLTMLVYTWLSGGNPPLFMDFRKVWEGWEIQTLAKKMGITGVENELWYKKGFVDGDNSGSAALDWAAAPGASVEQIMAGVSFPRADADYFPGLGNSMTFVSPKGIKGIAGRMAYSSLSDAFSMVWDEASTTELPGKLSQAVCETSNPTWPHTFVIPEYASMVEYKQYAPANHLHMTWGLNAARLQYWMDMANVLSVTPWQARPAFREGIDRPLPLLYLLNGGEDRTKLLLKGR